MVHQKANPIVNDIFLAYREQLSEVIEMCRSEMLGIVIEKLILSLFGEATRRERRFSGPQTAATSLAPKTVSLRKKIPISVSFSPHKARSAGGAT
jgi:hypothetical protein